MTASTRPRTVRKARRADASAKAEPPSARAATKLDLVVAELVRPSGASLAELVAVTGWQRHSVRGALAGALKKKGHAVVSETVDGERRYRIGAAK